VTNWKFWFSPAGKKKFGIPSSDAPEHLKNGTDILAPIGIALQLLFTSLGIRQYLLLYWDNEKDIGASMKPSLSRLAVKIVFVLFFVLFYRHGTTTHLSLALVLDHCGCIYAAMANAKVSYSLERAT
jgi:hypothetical protein